MNDFHRQMMNTKQKELFPEWCNDTTTDFSLCLSDDLDSLLSCVILEHLKGYKIDYLYTFSGIGRIKENMGKKVKCIGVDADLTKGECWGNHVTMLSPIDSYNKQCANLNVVNQINRKNYTSKFCGSTVLQILSYYNVDISKLNEEGQMILLCIDASYVPFYNDIFKETATRWMNKVLEYPELTELTKKYTKADFEKLNVKYGLYEKIKLNNGYLETNIDLASLSEIFLLPMELPTQQFILLKEFLNCAIPVNKYNFNITKTSDIFSLAVTRKNFYNFSKIYNRED